MKRMKGLNGLLWGILFVPAALIAEEQKAWSGSVSAQWISDYILEGLPVIESGSVYAWNAQFEKESLELNVNYLAGISEDYQEFKTTVQYNNSYEQWDYSLGASHLEFVSFEQSDLELFFGLGRAIGTQFYVSSELLYAKVNNGSLLSISLDWEPIAFDDDSQLILTVSEIVELGYSDLSFNGPSFTQIGGQFSFEGIGLTWLLSLNSTFPHSDLKREGAEIETWASVEVSWAW